MPRIGEWAFCRKHGCKDAWRLSSLKDYSSAREWLGRHKTNVAKMLAMRELLWQENASSPLSEMSDDEIIHQAATLLSFSKVHVHAPQPEWNPVFMQGGNAASAPAFAPARSSQPSGYSPPPADPSTFPSNLDGAAQANALAAAAAGGQPFCPQ